MILVDREIEHLAIQEGLIGHFDTSRLVNCRYNLRAGRAFAAETGKEVIVGGPKPTTTSPFWEIKPSESIMIMTLETVNLPGNLMATYGPLFSLAKKGLLLV